MAKVVFEAAQSDPSVLDHEFLRAYTNGADAYRALVEATPWADLIRQSGLAEAEIRRAAQIYLRAERTVISWCLGVSQHEHGVDTVREIVNLLMLRGNIGRPAPARHRSAGTATCRATAPAGSTTTPRRHGSRGWTRCAASARPAPTVSTRCTRSRR